MTRSRAQAGRLAKRKGDAFERSIARKLSTWSGEEFTRATISGGNRVRKRHDVVGPEWWENLYAPEVKKREGWTWENMLRGNGPVWEWWDQAVTQAEGREPLLIFSRNRLPDYVMLRDMQAADLLSDHGELQVLCDIPAKGVSVFLLDDLLTTDPEWWRQ